MSNPRRCYYILESVDKGEDIFPSIVVEGEEGHYPTDWNWGKDMDQAKKCAAELNEELGLSQEDVDNIVMSSMFPSKTKNRE